MRRFSVTRPALFFVALLLCVAAVWLPSRARTAGSENTPLRPAADGSITLPADEAEVVGESLEVQPKSQIATGWANPDDRATWHFEAAEAGEYDVMLSVAVAPQSAEPSLVVELDRQRVLTQRIAATDGIADFRYATVGQITLSPGQHSIAIHPADSLVPGSVAVRALSLVPAGREGFVAPQITAPEGFSIELAAAPPLVRYPMMACFDDRGRLFVAESDGENRKAPNLLEEKPHEILMLEDTDGDGRFDRRTVFADQMVLPNGAHWHDGALYVCSPPYLWRLEDTDGDGRADRRDRVLGRFNFTGMSDSLHGPVLGPDGRMYFCGGQHGWVLGPPDENLPIESDVPGVFSAWPDGSDPEKLASGGICNPVEVSFSPEGEAFGSVAVYDDFDGRHDAFLHWIDGGVFNLSPHRYEKVAMTGDALPAMSRRGHVAPSGNMRYRGDAFGPEYRDSYFLCEFNTHKVYRLAVERQGATFRSRDEVFLSTDHPYSHFTDVLQDADGSLLVVDTGGWFLYGCPTSQIARPDVRGAIYRIRKRGATAPDDPRGVQIAWPEASPSRLVDLLDDPRYAVRDRAIAELARRASEAIPGLEAALQSDSETTRRNAVWALCRMRMPDAMRLVRSRLTDDSESVQMAALHTVKLARDREAVDAIVPLLSREEVYLRRAAAAAMGRIGDARAAEPLISALRSADDRFLEHAILYALIEIGDRGALLPALSDANPNVRRAALIALDQMPDGELTRDLVVPLLDTDDVPLQTAALGVITRHKGWADEILGRLDAWLSEPLGMETCLASLRGALLAFVDDAGVQTLIAEHLGRNQTSPATRQLLLEVIGRSGVQQLPEAWRAQLDAALRRGDEAEVTQAVVVIDQLESRQFDGRLLEIARQPRYSTPVRLAALRAAARGGTALQDADVNYLIDQLGPQSDPIQRLTAADALGRATLSDEQLLSLCDAVAHAGPLELPALLSAFEPPRGAQIGLKLVAALQTAPGLVNVPAARLARLIESYPADVASAAEPLWDRVETDVSAMSAKLAKLSGSTPGGDARRGREVFFGRRAACSACHRVGDEGGNVGPNLSKIGEIRTHRDLIEAIAFPSASFARGYESIQIATRDGRIHSGVIARETGEALFLRTAERAEIRIERDQVEQLSPSSVSVMPQGMDEVLTPQELADLLAYLESLR
ncbi:MAG: PVC-type heme-binding CxxCH protein [Pirellulales bacterium]